MKVRRFLVELKFFTDQLGTAPTDPNIYETFIASKKANEDLKDQPAEVKAAVTKALAKEEIDLLPDVTDENRGITVFRRNKRGLILMDFMCRGYIKEAAGAMGQENAKGDAEAIWNAKGKIDRWLHVEERQVPILRGGKPVKEADDVFQRPLRAETMKGPRVTLSASERIRATDDNGELLPVERIPHVKFHLLLLPLGEHNRKGDEVITFETIKSWLEFGALQGMGQWRSGGNGKFASKVTDLGNANFTVDFDTLLPTVSQL